MNELAILTENPEAVNTVYNTAYGDRTTLTQLVQLLKENLAQFDPKIAGVEVVHGPNRVGDIPHSLASIEKAKNNLGYHPKYSIEQGIKEAVSWYFHNLK
jgi:UDP-N-acetylglucosamine 4-epimerase